MTMIIRQCIKRRCLDIGRKGVASPSRPWTRSLATAIKTIEASLDNNFQDMNSIEAALRSQLVRRIEVDFPESPGPRKPELSLEDRTVREKYLSIQHQRTFHLSQIASRSV